MFNKFTIVAFVFTAVTVTVRAAPAGAAPIPTPLFGIPDRVKQECTDGKGNCPAMSHREVDEGIVPPHLQDPPDHSPLHRPSSDKRSATIEPDGKPHDKCRFCKRAVSLESRKSLPPLNQISPLPLTFGPGPSAPTNVKRMPPPPDHGPGVAAPKHFEHLDRAEIEKRVRAETDSHGHIIPNPPFVETRDSHLPPLAGSHLPASPTQENSNNRPTADHGLYSRSIGDTPPPLQHVADHLMGKGRALATTDAHPAHDGKAPELPDHPLGDFSSLPKQTIAGGKKRFVEETNGHGHPIPTPHGVELRDLPPVSLPVAHMPLTSFKHTARDNHLAIAHGPQQGAGLVGYQSPTMFH